MLLVEESICTSSLCELNGFIHRISVGKSIADFTDGDLIIFGTNDEVVRLLDKVLSNCISIILIIL